MRDVRSNNDSNPDIVAVTNIMYSGGDNAENDNKYPEIRGRIHFYLIMAMALSQMIITLFQGQITTEFLDIEKDIKAI